MIPPALLDDLVSVLARLDDDDLADLHDLYLAVGDIPTVERVVETLRLAVEREHHRRQTGEAYRLDDLDEALGCLSDDDVARGAAIHAEIVAEADPVHRRWHAVVGQMLAVEKWQRAATDRRLRRAMLDDLPESWGSHDDRGQA